MPDSYPFNIHTKDKIEELLSRIDNNHPTLESYISDIQEATILMAYLQTTDRGQFKSTIKNVEDAIKRFTTLQGEKKPANWRMFN